MKYDQKFARQMADLAKIPLDGQQAEQLASEFDESMAVVDELTKIQTEGVAPTYQVNDLINVWREDVIDEKRMLSQEAALANAPRTHQGYFVVERVIDHEA